jgi:hypothetical protein
VTPTQVLRFVSRADHLKWREQWKRGRWVRLSWPPAEQAAILRQDEEYRLADIRWASDMAPLRAELSSSGSLKVAGSSRQAVSR